MCFIRDSYFNWIDDSLRNVLLNTEFEVEWYSVLNCISGIVIFNFYFLQITSHQGVKRPAPNLTTNQPLLGEERKTLTGLPR